MQWTRKLGIAWTLKYIQQRIPEPFPDDEEFTAELDASDVRSLQELVPRELAYWLEPDPACEDHHVSFKINYTMSLKRPWKLACTGSFRHLGAFLVGL